MKYLRIHIFSVAVLLTIFQIIFSDKDNDGEVITSRFQNKKNEIKEKESSIFLRRLLNVIPENKNLEAQNDDDVNFCNTGSKLGQHGDGALKYDCRTNISDSENSSQVSKHETLKPVRKMCDKLSKTACEPNKFQLRGTTDSNSGRYKRAATKDCKKKKRKKHPSNYDNQDADDEQNDTNINDDAYNFDEDDDNNYVNYKENDIKRKTRKKVTMIKNDKRKKHKRKKFSGNVFTDDNFPGNDEDGMEGGIEDEGNYEDIDNVGGWTAEDGYDEDNIGRRTADEGYDEDDNIGRMTEDEGYDEDIDNIGRWTEEDGYEEENNIGKRTDDEGYDEEDNIGGWTVDEGYDEEDNIGRRTEDEGYDEEDNIGGWTEDDGYEEEDNIGRRTEDEEEANIGRWTEEDGYDEEDNRGRRTEDGDYEVDEDGIGGNPEDDYEEHEEGIGESTKDDDDEGIGGGDNQTQGIEIPGGLGKYFVYVNCTSCRIKSQLAVLRAVKNSTQPDHEIEPGKTSKRWGSL